MLLHTATAITAAVDHHRLRRHAFSPSPSNSRSPLTGFSTSTLPKPPRSSTISCSSKSRSRSSGTAVDLEKRKKLDWYTIYKRISMLGYPEKGNAATVLDQYENEGIKISRFDLSRIIKELRKFGRHEFALQGYEWMNNRADKYRQYAVDAAIHLDLISKVHGISKAEDYFLSFPESLRKKELYGSLLNAYAHFGMREKAESLFDEIRNRGYADGNPRPYNVMLTLYMKLEEHDKVECMVLEMDEKHLLDIYSYNIWLTSRGYQGSPEKMEQVFERMKRDTSVVPNWSTYSVMASMFIKMGELEKGKDYLGKLESGIKGQDRTAYHYLISLYGSVGNKEGIHSVWNDYKSYFAYIPNMGYHLVITSLLRLDDIEGAENAFHEWMSAKTHHDARIANHLLRWYLKNGQLEKVESVFTLLVDAGRKPSSKTLGILAQVHIKKRRVSEALSCLRDAALAEGSSGWRPNYATIASFIKLCEEEDDMKSKEELMKVLSEAGCFEYEDYLSYIASQNDSEKDGDEISDGAVLNELYGGLE
ncbi:unnamed protein product [Cuscuta campestris]|uniref:Pentacotripeptide-repeat region of PRORP domain-containing protein n=1 Tax=Cuscuta campestris TaxID=132261 RepID=A0A484M623_9ASTE|nr:unnamed protein product [Cuscuta campestris]